MTKLKPCPFCGEIPEITTFWKEGPTFTAWIDCDCGVQMRSSRSHTREEAVEEVAAKWNRRTEDA